MLGLMNIVGGLAKTGFDLLKNRTGLGEASNLLGLSAQGPSAPHAEVSPPIQQQPMLQPNNARTQASYVSMFSNDQGFWGGPGPKNEEEL